MSDTPLPEADPNETPDSNEIPEPVETPVPEETVEPTGTLEPQETPVQNESELPVDQENATDDEPPIEAGEDEQDDEDEEEKDPDAKYVDEAQKTRAKFDEAGEQVNEEARTREQARETEFKRPSVKLREISGSERHRASQLYVEAASFVTFVEDVFTPDKTGLISPAERLWIVAGVPRSGRFITATRLATQLMSLKASDQMRSVWFYADREKSLQEVVADPNLPSRAVIIFEGAFENRLTNPEELLRFSGFNTELKTRDIRFILTVSTDYREFDDLINRFPIVYTHQPDLKAVFTRLVDYHFGENDGYAEDNAKLKKLLEDCADVFQPPRTAADVESWFRRHNNNATQIEQYIRERKYQDSPAIRQWFDKLPNLNYKLYALLVVLFERLDLNVLDQIYEASVVQMREIGMDSSEEFIDPRRIGTQAFDNLLLLRRRGNQIDFADDIYRAEVKRQVENYQRLLWTLVDSFIDVVKVMNENFDGSLDKHNRLSRRLSKDRENRLLERRAQAAMQDMDNSRRLRDVIASAIAQIGIYHPEKLRAKLDELASHDEAFVVLTASMMLANIVQQGDHHALVVDVLSEWVKSGNFDLMWAAAVSISRVYETVIRNLPPVDTPPADADTQRRRTADRELLDELNGLLEDLAKNYNVYDEEYKGLKLREIKTLLLIQLRDEFDELITKGVQEEELPREVLTAYRAANGETQTLLALQYIPSAEEQVEKTAASVLQKQQESWCDQIQLGVVNAIAYIATNSPSEMVLLIERWIKHYDSGEPVWQAAHMALNRLFRQSENFQVVLQERFAFPLLKLFKILLQLHRPFLTGFEELWKGLFYGNTFTDEHREKHAELVLLLTDDPLNTALKSTLNWYVKAIEMEQDTPDIEDEEDVDFENAVVDARAKAWEDHVYPELLKAINHATHEQRVQFRRYLINEWLMLEHEHFDIIRRVAHALIARSHVMDGMVMDLPQIERTGVLILDGHKDESLDKIFSLAQRLSALVPLEVMKLGDARQKFLVGIPGSESNVSDWNSFTLANLRHRGHRRPPLLMPLLHPRQSQTGREAAGTYFIIVYSKEPLADLPDFFDIQPISSSAPAARKSIFQNRQQENPVEVSAPVGEWNQKVFVISDRPGSIPAHVIPHVTFISEKDAADYGYRLFQGQIAKSLHEMTTADTMWRDLERYLPETMPRTIEELQRSLSDWLSKLNQTHYTHPRHDISLTIAWSLLALSREPDQGCKSVVEIVEQMLEGDNEDSHQMGMACARLLFNFYSANPAQLSVKKHGALLRLLPAFNRTARDYTDLIPVWSVLISWAQETEWLDIFQPSSELDDSPTDGAILFDSIDNLKERDARLARKWLERYDRLAEFWTLFMDVGKPVRDFFEIITKVNTYRNARREWEVAQKNKSKKKSPAPKPPILEPQLSMIASFLPENKEDDHNALLGWQLEKVNMVQSSLLNPNLREQNLEQARNMQKLAERLRNRLSRRLAGKLPELRGKQAAYGVMILQGDDKKLTEKAVQMANIFAEMRARGQFSDVTLTIHRQGSPDIVRHIAKTRRLKTKDLFDSQKRLALIGPALDRYPGDYVGFVIVLSDKPVLDYDDWGENDGWGERLWTVRSNASRWQPSRGEHLHINEPSEQILEQIASRITQRRIAHD